MTNVFDDLATAFHTKIHIDIRWADALGIQESFENQAVSERVNVGDAEHVGDERTGGGSAARPDRDTLFLRISDKVPDDEEIANESGFFDHRELVVQAGR